MLGIIQLVSLFTIMFRALWVSNHLATNSFFVSRFCRHADCPTFTTGTNQQLLQVFPEGDLIVATGNLNPRFTRPSPRLVQKRVLSSSTSSETSFCRSFHFQENKRTSTKNNNSATHGDTNTCLRRDYSCTFIIISCCVLGFIPIFSTPLSVVHPEHRFHWTPQDQIAILKMVLLKSIQKHIIAYESYVYWWNSTSVVFMVGEASVLNCSLPA